MGLMYKYVYNVWSKPTVIVVSNIGMVTFKGKFVSMKLLSRVGL